MSEIAPIRPVERAAAPVTVDTTPSPPARPAAREAQGPEQKLDPAVTLDISADAKPERAARTETDYKTQFVRDPEAKTLVYQVVDPASGDVVVQLPSVTVLKNRVYAEANAARAAPVAPVIQTPVDRIA